MIFSRVKKLIEMATKKKVTTATVVDTIYKNVGTYGVLVTQIVEIDGTHHITTNFIAGINDCDGELMPSAMAKKKQTATEDGQ